MFLLQIWRPLSLAADAVLKPLGLIMWTTYDMDDVTGALRIRAVRIGRRPAL